MTNETMILQFEDYYKRCLEPVRKEFGGLPACPFVKHERLKDQILYACSEIRSPHPTDELVSVVRSFRNRTSKHMTLMVVDTEKTISVLDLVTLGLELCGKCRDERMIAIGVHPDDPFEVAGFRTRGAPFVSLLCQEVEYISWAKHELKRLDYYSRWTAAALDYNRTQIGQFLADST
jgi:hypothetical protein